MIRAAEGALRSPEAGVDLVVHGLLPAGDGVSSRRFGLGGGDRADDACGGEDGGADGSGEDALEVDTVEHDNSP